MAFKLSQVRNATIIGGTEKNPIVLFPKIWQGDEYIDIRSFWTPDDMSEPIATKKGVMIAIQNVPVLIDALQKLV